MFFPLIQRGNSGSSGAMPNYFGFYGILPGMLAKIEKIFGGAGVVAGYAGVFAKERRHEVKDTFEAMELNFRYDT